jgi:hypothetical protein
MKPLFMVKPADGRTRSGIFLSRVETGVTLDLPYRTGRDNLVQFDSALAVKNLVKSGAVMQSRCNRRWRWPKVGGEAMMIDSSWFEAAKNDSIKALS